MEKPATGKVYSYSLLTDGTYSINIATTASYSYNTADEAVFFGTGTSVNAIGTATVNGDGTITKGVSALGGTVYDDTDHGAAGPAVKGNNSTVYVLARYQD
jgi:hypothetical protein